MPTIIHKKNYINTQKKVSLIITVLSLLVMLFFYMLYRIYSQTIYFIVLSALCAIPAAQFCTRYVLFFPHKDCNCSIADELTKLPSSCFVINTALFTDGQHNKMIDNIIVSGDKILCIINTSNKYSIDAVKYLRDILNSKDIKYDLKEIDIKNYNFKKISSFISNQETTPELIRVIKAYLI